MKKSNESNFYRDRETLMNEYPKWTISLSHHDLVKGFFIALSFTSMISTGYYGIPLVSKGSPRIEAYRNIQRIAFKATES
ncbi:MAG TPA: hypothetical protein VFX18_05345 [Candidatus Nitrosocosmicus sp.]|nr:hypothetical protein [Candidatus Nitrosocosmicus sp.]